MYERDFLCRENTERLLPLLLLLFFITKTSTHFVNQIFGGSTKCIFSVELATLSVHRVF